jgi:hypothetical protein
MLNHPVWVHVVGVEKEMNFQAEDLFVRINKVSCRFG